MSLPSHIYFIKDGLIVGISSVNVGWSVSSYGLIRCLWTGWHDAKSYFDKQPFSEQQMASGWYERIKPWYTTREDLLAFDHAYLYEQLIPRDVYEALHRNPDCQPKIEELLQKGMYKDDGGEFKTAMKATKLARGID